MNKGSTAKVIDIAFYNAGYAARHSDGENNGYDVGYRERRADYKRRGRERRESKYAKRQRRLYFLKQKTIGVLLLFGTISIVWLLEGDATFALFSVPLSLALVFSKNKWLLDDKYYERKE